MMNLMKEASEYLAKYSEKEEEAEKLFLKLINDICNKYNLKIYENRVSFNQNMDGNYSVEFAGNLSANNIEEINSILNTKCEVIDNKYFQRYFFKSDYFEYHKEHYQ